MREFLDQAVPLAAGSHADAVAYQLTGGRLIVTLKDAAQVALADEAAFVGYRGDATALSVLLFRHHGLHIELEIDRGHPIGRDDPAGIGGCRAGIRGDDDPGLRGLHRRGGRRRQGRRLSELVGLMQGTLAETFEKGGKPLTRRLHTDRFYTTPDGGSHAEAHAASHAASHGGSHAASQAGRLQLPGRSLMLIRNVGLHMYTNAVLDADGAEIPRASWMRW